MIDFSRTTAFGLVRRMAILGGSAPAIYLLISRPSDVEAVRADLAAEVDIQLAVQLDFLEPSIPALEKWLNSSVSRNAREVVLLALGRPEQKVISFLDRNVVLMAQRGQVLVLTERSVGERMLAGAPNLRNRIADVLAIDPDDALSGAD